MTVLMEPVAGRRKGVPLESIKFSLNVGKREDGTAKPDSRTETKQIPFSLFNNTWSKPTPLL